MPGPLPIGALAERLGVTQQAASKAVADLERRGYVERASGAADGRVRHVSLTERGLRGDRGRAAATAPRCEAELAHKLGPRRAEGARRLLADVAAELGAGAAVRGRRVRPPR